MARVWRPWMASLAGVEDLEEPVRGLVQSSGVV